MNIESVPPEVQRHIINTRRVFEFYSYVNLTEKYLRDKVAITAQFNPRSRPSGVTIHFSDPGRSPFVDVVRFTDGTALEFHNFSYYLYRNPL